MAEETNVAIIEPDPYTLEIEAGRAAYARFKRQYDELKQENESLRLQLKEMQLECTTVHERANEVAQRLIEENVAAFKKVEAERDVYRAQIKRAEEAAILARADAAAATAQVERFRARNDLIRAALDEINSDQMTPVVRPNGHGAQVERSPAGA